MGFIYGTIMELYGHQYIIPIYSSIIVPYTSHKLYIYLYMGTIWNSIPLIYHIITMNIYDGMVWDNI